MPQSMKVDLRTPITVKELINSCCNYKWRKISERLSAERWGGSSAYWEADVK